MSSFVPVMQSAVGRLLRIVVGAVLIVIGYLVWGVGGLILAIIGLVPLIAGALGKCFAAPLFGYTVNGKKQDTLS